MNIFEDDIRLFEKMDAENFPKEGVIVFTGSSSITMWESLSRVMEPLNVINRGFGGSEMCHLLSFAKRIITPYKPSKVVIYEGDNDIAAGTTPEQFIDESKLLVELIQKYLPETQIYFLSIKLSPSRRNLWNDYKKANSLLMQLAYNTDKVGYIDVCTPMLDTSGNANDMLFGEDLLHMSPEGYKLWTSIIKKRLTCSTKGSDPLVDYYRSRNLLHMLYNIS